MKNSKILKIVSYIAIPILILTVALSVYYVVIKNYLKEDYFSSDSFIDNYMSDLIYQTNILIHNDNYEKIQDGEIEISYTNSRTNKLKIKDYYFLIIYKNKALTNVELTSETDTIEKIRNYISENDGAKVTTIIDGKLDSESKIIANKGIKYLSKFKDKYYKTIYEEQSGAMIAKQYTTYSIEDLDIYSSYVEEFKEDSYKYIMMNWIKNNSIYEPYIYIIIPTFSILLLLTFIYLIISIGHTREKDNIDLNDFDKIPIEIILFISIILGALSIVPAGLILEKDNLDLFSLLISMIITSYLVIYGLCAITTNTIIKRIKSKTLLKSSIIGKSIFIIKKFIKKINTKIQEIWNILNYSLNTTIKLIIYVIIILIFSLIILFIFRASIFTFLFEGILFGSIFIKVLNQVKSFDKLEKKLKEMYNGNNKNKLNYEEFTKEFYNSVKYVNDISNGFENAIQDRIKGEKLKAELITNVSHDIKTPLTSIINYVDLLKNETIENEKAKEYISILDNKSQRLKKLTEDLIEVSKVSTGNISLNLEIINIEELIKQAVGEFEDKFKSRYLEVFIDSTKENTNIMVDSKYMYRIIENIFSNIYKYALEKSRVYIDIKNIENKVKIEIKNISKDRLNITAEELIQRFVRGDKSRTTEGSGLGISIAKNLTELQNGIFNLILDGDLFKIELIFDII